VTASPLFNAVPFDVDAGIVWAAVAEPFWLAGGLSNATRSASGSFFVATGTAVGFEDELELVLADDVASTGLNPGLVVVDEELVDPLVADLAAFETVLADDFTSF
jgi:hypothetical protein